MVNKGSCAKVMIRCTIIAEDGSHFVGENWCKNPQEVCPRQPGEGYEKCTSICKQEGHAEQVAVMLAGDKAKGSRAYLEGHTYACMNCQHTLFDAGVKSFSIGSPKKRIAIVFIRAFISAVVTLVLRSWRYNQEAEGVAKALTSKRQKPQDSKLFFGFIAGIMVAAVIVSVHNYYREVEIAVAMNEKKVAIEKAIEDKDCWKRKAQETAFGIKGRKC